MAYFWLLMASAHGNINAARNRDYVVRRLTPQQRAAVDEAAQNWKINSAVPPIR